MMSLPALIAAHVRQFLQRCMDHGISLNADKFVFAQTEVKFAGFVLSPEGYSTSPELVAAITDSRTPRNITEVQSFFGLVNQLSTFTDTITILLEPIQHLLSPKREFLWGPQHDDAFIATKTALASPPSLAYFDMSRPLALDTDGSKLHGLGYILKQKQPDGHWHAVQAGSRSLTDAETRYAAVELEMLAEPWAMAKCRTFLAGLQNFDVVTDHKLLLPLLNSKSLDCIENPRLQRLRSRLMEFVFTAHWCQGRSHAAPDALSLLFS